MTLQHGYVIVCLMLALVSHSQGLQFTRDTTPDGGYCGHLRCWAIKGITDNIQSVVGLVVYDVTQSNLPVKLVSVSASDPNACVPNNKLNSIQVTGNASRYHAEVTIRPVELNYCYNRTYLCVLEYIDVNGNIDVIRVTVTPESSRNCYEFENEFVRTGTENFELRQENTDLKQENAVLKTQVSRLQEIVNSGDDLTEFRCLKDAPRNISREIITLWGTVPARCDIETDGGGWIVIQRRKDGNVDFYRDWNEYRNGFGTIDTDYWIGNDIISRLTSNGYTELWIDMEYQGEKYYAHYSYFYVYDVTSNYAVSVGGYSGTAGYDSFSYNSGVGFSTYDRDYSATGNCASDLHGGWWYSACTNVNLNGLWGAQDVTGAFWYGLVHPGSVSFSEMKVRRP